MRFVRSFMGITAHDCPIGSLDITKEQFLFLPAGPCLRRVIMRAGNKAIKAGRNRQKKAGHERLIAHHANDTGQHSSRRRADDRADCHTRQHAAKFGSDAT